MKSGPAGAGEETEAPGALGRRAASRGVFAAGASGSPLLGDRRQLHPGGGDEEEEPEKGQEDYCESAATTTAVQSELLVGASDLGINEPGGRRVALWSCATAAVCVLANETALARHRFRVNKEKGTGGSACRLHTVPAGALLSLLLRLAVSYLRCCIEPLATLGAAA